MSGAKRTIGQWLASKVLSRIPQVRREFDLNRDPLIARQLDDMAKTEKQRRDETDGRGYYIPRKKQDKPEPAFKPPQHLRGDADREGSLLAQRDAAFARAAELDATLQPTRQQDLTYTRDYTGPSR